MKLILENWRKFVNEVSLGSDMAKSIEYTGLVLDPDHEGTKKLKSMVPKGWKEHSHHMTMIPPPKMKQRLPTGQFFEGCLKVVGVAINDKVMAAKVDIGDKLLYFKIEGVPHVTIATAIDPKKTKDPKNPVYYSAKLSNEFTDDDFTEPADFEICGKVEEVPPVKERELTDAELKKREEVAKAIERDDPDMPMDKKMAIATATAKKTKNK